MPQITYTYKQSLACSIAFCNGTCCEIKLIIKKKRVRHSKVTVFGKERLC